MSNDNKWTPDGVQPKQQAEPQVQPQEPVTTEQEDAFEQMQRMYQFGQTTLSGGGNPANLESMLKHATEMLGILHSYQPKVRLNAVLSHGSPLAVPALTIFTPLIEDGKKVLKAFSLFVGSQCPDDIFRPQMNHSDNSVHSYVTRGVIYDKVFHERVADDIGANFPEYDDYALKPMGHELIPKKVRVEDRNELTIHIDIAAQALYNACGVSDRPSVGLINKTGRPLNFSVKFEPGTTLRNTVGQPRETDVITTVSLGTQNTNSRTVHNDHRPMTLAQCAARVDFTFQPPTANYANSLVVKGQTVPAYQPLLIIRDSGASIVGSERAQESLTSKLLAHSSMYFMLDKEKWVSVFNHKFSNNIRCGLGQFGREWDPITGRPAEQGKELKVAPVDASGKPVKDHATPESIINAYCHDNAALAVDCPAAGYQEYMDRVLVAAACRNKDANDLILKTLDEFTDGHFSKIWTGGWAFIEKPIHLFDGVIYDNNSEERDLMTIGYLETLAITKGNQVDMYTWQRAHSATAEIKEIEEYRRQIGNKLNIDFGDLTYRLIYDNRLWTAFFEACVAAGLRIGVEGDLATGSKAYDYYAPGAYVAAAVPASAFSLMYQNHAGNPYSQYGHYNGYQGTI